jgi:hypothetical protein
MRKNEMPLQNSAMRGEGKRENVTSIKPQWARGVSASGSAIRLNEGSKMKSQ